VEDSAVAIDIMRLVVEAEGMAPPTNTTTDDAAEVDELALVDEARDSRAAALGPGISEAKYMTFGKQFQDAMFHRDEISLEEIVDEAASWSIDEDSFTEEDVQLILNHMEVEGKVMIHGGVVHLCT